MAGFEYKVCHSDCEVDTMANYFTRIAVVVSAVAILLSIGCTGENGGKQIASPTAASTLLAASTQPSATKSSWSTEARQMAQLYRDLLDFKDDPEFHTYCYATGHPYNNWMQKGQSMIDKGSIELLSETGITPVDLWNIGRDYCDNEGQKTDFISTMESYMKAEWMNMATSLKPSAYATTPTPAPGQCSTLGEKIYFDEMTDLYTSLALGIANMTGLNHQAIVDPLLIVDPDWQLNVVLVLAALGATANAMLDANAPPTLSRLHSGNETLAHQIYAYTDLYVAAIDNLDPDTMEQATEKLGDIESTSRTQGQRVREFCPNGNTRSRSLENPRPTVGQVSRFTPAPAPTASPLPRPTPTSTPTPLDVQPQISAGRYHICGLHSDGSITCWGIGRHGEYIAPQGRFRQLNSSLAGNCAVRRDYRAVCWGRIAVAPEEAFQQVSIGTFFACGLLKDDNRPVCWDDDGRLMASPLEGEFQQVTIGEFHACGIKTDGSVACWDLYEGAPYGDAPEGVFQQISAGGQYTCGLKNGGRIVCWAKMYDVEENAPEGTFRQVDTEYFKACAVRTNGDVVCWDIFHGDFDPTTPEGSFRQVSSGTPHNCALKDDGQVTCWNWSESGVNAFGANDPPEFFLGQVKQSPTPTPAR